jgi:two-component system LytT family response regulator
MDKLRVLIADDEQLARRRLTRLLSAMSDIEIAGECKSGEEVLERAKAGDVDIVLLDIRMPGLSGLEAMSLLPSGGPYVIFCTAHATHAIEAFDVGAIDYVLKPVEPGRLRKALERASTQSAQRRFEAEVERQRERALAARGMDRLAIPTRQGIVLADTRDITHAVLDGELVTVFTTKGDYLTDFTLQELERKLPAERFERVHRRALLNLDHVLRLEPVETGGYVARLSRGQAVDVSRQAARSLRRRFGLRKSADD